MCLLSRHSAVRVCGKDVELEVVVRRGQLVEPGERLLQRQRVVVAADREGGHHAEGHRGDRAQAPETDARRAPQVRVGLARALHHRAVGGHQLQRFDLGRDVAEPLSRAVGRGRDRARDRLHVDVAEVLERKPLASPAPRSGRGSRCPPRPSPGPRRGRPRAPGSSLQAEHHAVGAGDVGERMARRRRPARSAPHRPPGRPHCAAPRPTPGRSTAAGTHCWSPAQLRHIVAARLLVGVVVVVMSVRRHGLAGRLESRPLLVGLALDRGPGAGCARTWCGSGRA